MMMVLAAGALVSAMVPGVAAAADPQADFVPIVVPGNGQTPIAETVFVPEVAATNFPNN